MTVVNRSMYPVQTGFDQITRMQERFSRLQVQLATGERAQSLSDMGTDRFFDLSIRGRVGRIEGYQDTIKMVNLRLDVLDKVMGRLDSLEGEARSGLTPGGYGSGNINFGTAPTLAASRLDEVLSLLNTEVDGRYLFAGNRTDKKPVQSMDAILNGAAGRAGFKAVAAERSEADLGANGLGRLTLAVATDTVTLTEDGTHDFGMKLSTLTTSSAGIAVTVPVGVAPQTLSVQFTGQPLEGESVTIGLTLPDGTEAGITLKAVTGTPAAGEFQIGADPDDTAANFSAALQGSLTRTARTELAAASTFSAAANFFNEAGDAVMRVDGPPYDTATAMIAGDPATTVFWYRGEDSGAPRASVSAKVDENTNVKYGVQANESGLLELVRSLASVAIQTFPSADPNAKERFDAMASRNISHLAESHNGEPGSIEMITVELGNARSAVTNISQRHVAYGAQLGGMLSDIETVTPEEVAMEMLALQTRLTASYQATSVVSQLNFANFLR